MSSLHPNQIIRWKKHLQAEVGSLFSTKKDEKAKGLEGALARLYEEISRLKMERDWLKKKLDQP